MPQTVLATTDAKAVKRWAADLFIDTNKKSYFSRKFIGQSDNSVIQRKTELDSEAGDRVSFDLSVQLRGTPTTGDNRIEGKEEQLKFYTDEVIIDQLRKGVSSGGRMTRKRTIHDLRSVARDRLGDYWSKYIDELYFIYLSGARGINQDFFEPTSYTGHAGNSIQAPDSAHIIYGGSATTKATVASTDKMARSLIEKCSTTAMMMRAQDPTVASVLPVSVEGEPHYVLLMCPWQEYQLRTESSSQGWLEMQKALATAAGRKSEIFTGGLGMVANVVLHSHESVIRFTDYGAGTNVAAARALFMGRQAGVVAYGSSGGLRFDWKEEEKDYGNELAVVAGCTIGVKKARFNSKDFGIVAVDTAAAAP